MDLRTARGYDLYDVASALQKAIRRSDFRVAGYFAIELFESGYDNYLWKRLLTISAEDVEGIITKEIWSLKQSYDLVNAKNKKGKKRGRVFISKAVILLCDAVKSRDADHIGILLYDKGMAKEEAEQFIENVRNERIAIPEYAYDVHTKKGKRMGKTKREFLVSEFEALAPERVSRIEQEIYLF